MKRLQVTFDGKPVYLYELIQGSYEDKCNYVCVHAEELSRAEVNARLVAAARELPEEIKLVYSTEQPRQPDLFERALVLAGFTVVDSEITLFVARGAHPPVTERRRLERALEREAVS